MAEKGFGKTVLGWFVVEEGGGKAKAESADDLIKKYGHYVQVIFPLICLSKESPD